MPDKFPSKCGSTCIRCWRNRLKHANPQVKKFLIKNNIKSIDKAFNNPLEMEIKENNLKNVLVIKNGKF